MITITANTVMILLSLLSVDSNFDVQIQLSKNYMDSVELAIRYAHEAEEYAENKAQLGRVYWMLGTLYERNKRPTSAANYYYGAAKVYESEGDYINTARLLENIGTLAMNYRYPEMALRAYAKSLNAVRKADNYKLETRLLYDMGLAYLMHAEYAAASKALMDALKMLRIKGNVAEDSDTYAKIYNELGLVNKYVAHDYQEPDLYDSALVYFGEALDWSTSRATAIGPLNNIGNIYLAKNLIDSAESYFKRVLKVGENMGSVITPTVNNLAKIRFSRGDYTGADSLFRRAITLNLDSDLEQINSKNTRLSNVTELEISYRYLDSLNNYLPSDNRALLAKVNEIHITRKNLEALELRKQIELNETQFSDEVAYLERKETKQRWAERIGLGLLLIAAVTALVWYVLLIRARRKALANEIMRIERQYNDV